jgi:hypothetical protein
LTLLDGGVAKLWSYIPANDAEQQERVNALRGQRS